MDMTGGGWTGRVDMTGGGWTGPASERDGPIDQWTEVRVNKRASEPLADGGTVG